MPNHFHLTLKQLSDYGISSYMANVQNSYTRFFNITQARKGRLFEDRFKAVRVESNEQLVHLSRYIHLNPYTGFLVKSTQVVLTYPWSSLQEYLNLNVKLRLSNPDPVLNQFTSARDYKTFVLNNASYQRQLAQIEHLKLEN